MSMAVREIKIYKIRFTDVDSECIREIHQTTECAQTLSSGCDLYYYKLCTFNSLSSLLYF